MLDRYKKIGPVWLAKDIDPIHVATFLLVALPGISVTTWISTIQPYLLTVNLGLPADQQGKVSGMALFAGGLVAPFVIIGFANGVLCATALWLARKQSI
jgi:hypothetical protein